MILVDYRKGGERKGDTPKELVSLISKLGVPCELSDLQFGDVAFEGRGPEGTVAIGIERKTLHDMLHCIDDARLSGHQLVGMRDLYHVRVVLLEGHWRAHEEGWLMEGFHGGTTWGFCKPGGKRVLYAKLYRYLISLQLSGTLVMFSRDLSQTALNVAEWYHYFQKPWHQHTSLQELPKVAIPTLNHKPPLVRRWANELTDVGLHLSDLMARHFKTAHALATADETDFLKIPGIGVKTAQQIVREIWGKR